MNLSQFIKNFKSELFFVLIILKSVSFVNASCIPGASMVYQRYSDSSFQIWANPTKNGVRMTWDFGDGTTGNGRVVFHTYYTQGKYTVQLFLWDSAATCGDTFSESFCFYYFNSKPVFSRSADTLKASISCALNTIFKWAFDDGTYGWGCNISHVYNKPDFYKPILKFVQDTITGCTDTSHQYGFGAEPLDFTKCGFIPDFVPFVYPGLAMPYAYPFGKYNGSKTGTGSQLWRWGDGTSTLVSGLGFNQKSHTYNSLGTFTICHIVMDSAGTCMDSVCLKVKIDSCNVVPGFTYTTSGKQVQFTNTSGTNNVRWDIQGLGTSMVPDYKVNLPHYGYYNVCLRAIGQNNCTAQICKIIVLPGCDKPLNTSYKVDPTDCHSYHFVNNDYNVRTYFWDFGDSGSSVSTAPTYKFKRNGVFTVKLVANFDTIGGKACKDSFSFNLSINCAFCGIKDSLVLDYDSTKPYEATLSNYSSGNIHRHFWDFGDGTSSASASPVHTYSMTGSIWLTYIATDTITNCADTVLFHIFIDSVGNVKRKVFVLNVKYHHPNNTSVSKTEFHVAKHLVAYPNPFKDQLVLTCDDGWEITGIVMYNVLGRVIPSNYYIENKRCNIRAREHLSRGVYFIQVKTMAGIEWITVVRE